MRNYLISIQSNKLREHKGKDENKVPDLPRTKFVFVVRGAKALR